MKELKYSIFNTEKYIPIDDIDDKIYKFQNKCYTYKNVSVKCGNKPIKME